MMLPNINLWSQLTRPCSMKMYIYWVRCLDGIFIVSKLDRHSLPLVIEQSLPKVHHPVFTRLLLRPSTALWRSNPGSLS